MQTCLFSCLKISRKAYHSRK